MIEKLFDGAFIIYTRKIHMLRLRKMNLQDIKEQWEYAAVLMKKNCPKILKFVPAYDSLYMIGGIIL